MALLGKQIFGEKKGKKGVRSFAAAAPIQNVQDTTTQDCTTNNNFGGRESKNSAFFATALLIESVHVDTADSGASVSILDYSIFENILAYAVVLLSFACAFVMWNSTRPRGMPKGREKGGAHDDIMRRLETDGYAPVAFCPTALYDEDFHAFLHYRTLTFGKVDDREHKPLPLKELKELVERAFNTFENVNKPDGSNSGTSGHVTDSLAETNLESPKASYTPAKPANAVQTDSPDSTASPASTESRASTGNSGKTPSIDPTAPSLVSKISQTHETPCAP